MYIPRSQLNLRHPLRTVPTKNIIRNSSTRMIYGIFLLKLILKFCVELFAEGWDNGIGT